MADDRLVQFIEDVSGDSHLRVENDFGGGFVRLRSAEAERRQAKHDVRSSEDIVIEMLRNARDAGARSIFVATSRKGTARRFAFIDDGSGVPRRMWGRIFEARVTSKLDSVHMDAWGIHGRGMALYAIAQNSERSYVSDSLEGGGTSIVVETDTSSLPEKADQSSRPVFARTERGTIVARGPKNIVRTAAEFAFIDRDQVALYLGSPVDIAATLWEYGKTALSNSAIAFCDDTSALPLCKRLAVASSPEDFAEIAHGIGLELSPRSARRIMDGSISPLIPLSEEVAVLDSPATGTDSALNGRSSKEGTGGIVPPSGPTGALHLSEDEKRALAEGVLRAFDPIARAYYLAPNVQISTVVRGGAIHVTIPVVPEP